MAFTLKAKFATNRPSMEEGYVATSPAGRMTKLPGRHLPRLLIHLYVLESTPIRRSVPPLVVICRRSAGIQRSSKAVFNAESSSGAACKAFENRSSQLLMARMTRQEFLSYPEMAF